MPVASGGSERLMQVDAFDGPWRHQPARHFARICGSSSRYRRIFRHFSMKRRKTVSGMGV
jgi:hypothetical protein